MAEMSRAAAVVALLVGGCGGGAIGPRETVSGVTPEALAGTPGDGELLAEVVDAPAPEAPAPAEAAPDETAAAAASRAALSEAVVDAEPSEPPPPVAEVAPAPVVVTPPRPGASALEAATGRGGAAAGRASVGGRGAPAPVAPGAAASGGDSEDALGALMGDELGDSAGYGGLGLRGTGRGGGGTGEGTIGLGRVGTIGHGAGAGSGSGYGRGMGHSAGGGALRGRSAPAAAPPPGPPGPRFALGEREQVRAARVLTAAVVPDTDDRAGYLSYLERHGYEQATLRLDMSRRQRIRVVDREGRPVHDALLTLVGSGLRAVGRTHADGIWDFFPGQAAPGAPMGPADLYLTVGGRTARVPLVLPAAVDGRDVVVRLPATAAVSPRALDLAFLVDVTGSMGDEHEYLTAEVAGIVRRIRSAAPGLRIRVGATLYRDRGDEVPLAQIPFTEDVEGFARQLGTIEAEGGGDYPEDVNAGLAAALLTQDWSEDSAVRILVHIADAPPQMYPDAQYGYARAMLDAAARGIRILPVAASGADRVVEYLFRAMGAFTSSPYVYLTDDSGVGAPHLEADTDLITVEMLSDLLTRLVVSDLRGEGMHAPSRPPGIPSAPVDGQ